MSLISEALKEAQRERSQRAGARTAATVGESFFPYPSQTKTRRRSHRGFIIGASIVGIVAIGGAATLRWLASRQPSRPAVTPARVVPSIAPPVTKDSVVAPSVAAAPPQPSAADARVSIAAPHSPAGGTSTPVPEKSVASGIAPTVTPRSQPTASPGNPSAPIGTSAKKADSAVAAPAATLPAPSAAVKPSALRVVVDPASQAPGDSLFARAFAEHSRGNLDAAADLYEKAIARPPVAPELYNDYGALLAGRGKHTAAIAMYNLGIAANDHDSRLWTNLGDSYRAVGRRADAMSAYFEASKIDPSNVTVKVRLAGEYVAIGDTASARRGFEEAVRVAPRDPEAHYAFGSFLQAQRDYRGAARELQAFVDNASGRYSQDVIERTKSYVSNLRRQYP